MDFDNIPAELLEEIFSYLETNDLWRCLGVSRRWREIANGDRLWKKHCNIIGIDEAPLSSLSGSEDLCKWAAAYYIQYLLPIKNWRLKQYRLFELPVREQHFIEKWEGNRGVVYYNKIDRLIAYEINSLGIYSSNLPGFFCHITRDVFTLSLGLNKDYVAASNCNIINVYKQLDKAFKPYKIVYMHNDHLKIIDFNEQLMKDYFSFESTLQVETLLNDHLWVRDNYGDKFYLVNLQNNVILSIPVKSYFAYSINSPFIATWDDDITLYDCHGTAILKLNITCWDLCFNSKILVLGNKPTQRVETWHIKSGKQLMSKSVLCHTDMVIHPLKDIVVIKEQCKDIFSFRFTCIDANTGQTIWILLPHQNSGHLVKFVCDYVFVWQFFLQRPEFCLYDIRNGKLINEGIIPENMIHVSSTLLVFSETDRFKVMSYLGYDNQTSEK